MSHPNVPRTQKPLSCSSIFGISTQQLVRNYGSPLFVFGEHQIRSKIRSMRTAFDAHYPHVQFAWSYKTNCLGAILQIMHSDGLWAEVVSDMEYDKACHFLHSDQRLIANGPNKSKRLLDAAIRGNAILHVDHVDELNAVEEIARQQAHPTDIGIRLNVDVGDDARWSRFGFQLESGEAKSIADRIQRSNVLNLNAIHCHIGTSIRDVSLYRKMMEKLADFVMSIDGKISSIDIGGGFASSSLPRSQSDRRLPTDDQYAEAICETLQRRLPQDYRPTLIVESGRALIDDAGMLISSVVTTKAEPNRSQCCMIDAGTNLLPTAPWYHYKVDVASRNTESEQMLDTSLYGPLCMNVDVIEPNVSLPRLRRGDQLVLSPVGAYNCSQWQQFIEYRPNVILVRENGSTQVIRRAENLDDVSSAESTEAIWDDRRPH